jgi:hypothetical protein
MIYNQRLHTINVNDRTLRGIADGTPIRINRDGGALSKTEGTDGPGVNRATKQGFTIEIDVREDSPDHGYLANIERSQYLGTMGEVPLTITTGTKRVFSAPVQIAPPGNLSTGGPQMGFHTYVFMTTEIDLY